MKGKVYDEINEDENGLNQFVEILKDNEKVIGNAEKRMIEKDVQGRKIDDTEVY
jgi:hypothetical protein